MEENNDKLVLLIEDDLFFANLIKNKLITSGYGVEVIDDGEKAIQYLEKNKPSVVLLDIALPKVSGFEILGRIRLNPNLKDLPVIVISSLGQESDVKMAKDLGVVSYFIKNKANAHQLLEDLILRIADLKL